MLRESFARQAYASTNRTSTQRPVPDGAIVTGGLRVTGEWKRMKAIGSTATRA